MGLRLNFFTGQFDIVSSGAGGGIAADKTVTEIFTLSAGDITAKQITLTNTPTDNSLVRMVVIDGVEQENGADFSVSGTTVSWNGLGLDGILITGDKLIFGFNKA